MRRSTQLVDHHHGVGLLIEVPQALLAIGARFLEEQPLGEVVVERQRQLLAALRLRVGHTSKERVGGFAGESRSGVEPGQQPGVEIAPGQPVRADSAGLQRGHQTIAGAAQQLDRVLPIIVGLLPEPAVDHQANPPVAAAPRQVRHHMVVKQTARLADGFKVVLHRYEEGLGKRRASSARRDIALQAVEVRGKVAVVLTEELHHPGRLVELVEAVLQRIFQRIARRHQPFGLAALGADRLQLEYGTHRTVVIKQKALLLLQILDPWQVVGEAGVVRILGSLVGQRGAPTLHRAPGPPAKRVATRVIGHHRSSRRSPGSAYWTFSYNGNMVE
ncbi:hypothetical protein D3C77_215770 [compost metagenome]